MAGLTLAYVEAYLRNGWSVVPLQYIKPDGRCSCGNPQPDHDRRQGGKHPLWNQWQTHLIRDTAAAGRVWADGGQCQSANVGLATGAPSDFWVLDIDPDNGGREALAELELNFGMLPTTYSVMTGSGGTHKYWRMPDDFDPTNRRGALPRGLDVRGTGGLVVTEPSVSGKGAYLAMPDTAIVAAPGWLLTLIRPAPWEPRPVSPDRDVADQLDRLGRYAAAAVAGECEDLATAVEGTRNQAAFTAACRLHELVNAGWSGLNPNDVERQYFDAARMASDAGVTPFSWAEAQGCWRNAALRVGQRMAELPLDKIAGTWLTINELATMRPFVPTPYADPTRSLDISGVGFMEAIKGLTSEWPVVAPSVNGHDESVLDAEVVDALGREMIRGPATGAGFASSAAENPLPEQAKYEEPWAGLWAKTLTADEMATAPDPVPLINGLLDLDTTSWLIGKSGSYKSFLALDWAAHVALGLPWHGRRTQVGKVAYIVAEGARGMSLRVRAWQKFFDRPIGDNLRFLPEPVQAKNAGAWQLLVDMLRWWGEQPGGPVTLVVLDTQARMSVGLEENSNSEMGLFVAQADRIKAATGACVLTVHHIGRSGNDARGASSIDAAQDAELRVERAEGRPMALVLNVDKQKDQIQAGGIALQLVTVPGGISQHGRDLSSLVIDPMPQLYALGDGESDEDIEKKKLDGAAKLAAVLANTFNKGFGGTKAEIKKALFEKYKKNPMSEATWFRAWNDCLDRDVMRPFATRKANYRFHPAHLRAPLGDDRPDFGDPDIAGQDRAERS